MRAIGTPSAHRTTHKQRDVIDDARTVGTVEQLPKLPLTGWDASTFT